MSRSISIVAVVFLSAGVAWGHPQGEVVSYYASGASGFTIIDPVPAGGLVLTDFVGFSTGKYTIRENSTAVHQSVMSGAELNLVGVHVNSGIVVEEGSAITITHDVAGTPAMTISGYIPCADTCGLLAAGIIPAVGDVGLGVMVAIVLVAGAAVFNRCKRQAA